MVGEVKAMLTKLSEAEVSSSEGFKIKYGRDALTYSEGGRYIPVPIEHLGDPYEMAVYVSGIESWCVKGRLTDPITVEEKDILKKRVEECLRFLGRRFSMQ